MEKSSEKEKINYGELNEEFGDVDISDEEDMIQKEHADAHTTGKGKIPNKYEKQIKQGLLIAQDKYLFPNYFTSQKARAKITKQDEQEGNKILLQMQDKKDTKKKVTKKKKGSRSKSRKGKDLSDSDNIYDEQLEDDRVDLSKTRNREDQNMLEEDEECMYGDNNVLDCNAYIKQINQKNAVAKAFIKERFPKMKYMLDCGFNLLVYGVGSKVDILNLFY